MTPLRDKMIADLVLRNLSAGTREQYIRHVAAFARHYGCSPTLLGTDEVRAWLLDLQARGLAPATRIVHHAAMRFLYDHTLGRPEVMATVPRPRRGRQALGVPLVREEVQALLDVAQDDPRCFAMVATLVDTGAAGVGALRAADRRPGRQGGPAARCPRQGSQASDGSPA